MTSRRGFLAGASAALTALPGSEQAWAAPPPAGRFGHILMDADTGEVLDESAADDLFIPASTTKSITALAALSTLTPTTRFMTSVHARGPLTGGVLNGDLTLVGGGDAALDTQDLALLAKALHSKGVRRITGTYAVTGIDGPDTAVLNAQQPLQAGYNPAIGSLCLNYNRALLRWRNGTGGRRLSTHAFADKRSVPARSVLFREARGASLPRHDLADAREVWTIPAQSLRRDGERWFPVRRPALYAATVFRDLCIAEGITLPEPVETDIVPTGPPIAAHRSDVIFGQLKKMMKYSTNLTAEMMGIAATRGMTGIAPTTVEAAATATADWLLNQGIVNSAPILENHSGLSTRSRLSPRQMAMILRAGRERLGDAYASLHTTGKLRGSQDGLPDYTFRTKTGTMHFVRCLTGFIEVGRRNTVFAIFHGEDEQRALLDARYTPYDERKPQGGQRWLRGAVAHEDTVLRDWITQRIR